jgi:hypothetical protein
MILHEEEVPCGYPTHIYRVYGHLGEAAREAQPKYRELSTMLRGHRLKVRDTPEYLPPYKDICEYVDTLIAAEEQRLPVPAIPTELLPVG